MYDLLDQNQLQNEIASLWYQFLDEENVCLIIKTNTLGIKSLIQGCPLQIGFYQMNHYLLIGVRIFDIPNTPCFIYKIECEKKEQQAIMKFFNLKTIFVYLYNEMGHLVAQAKADISVEDAQHGLAFLNQNFYIGPNIKEMSDIYEWFEHYIRGIETSLSISDVFSLEMPIHLSFENVVNIYSYDDKNVYHYIENDQDEGQMFEQKIASSLISIFPHTLYSNPQLKKGKELREFTDILAYYEGGCFLIESKDTSVIKVGYHISKQKRIANIKKQIEKAIRQLEGAAKAFKAGTFILDIHEKQLNIDRTIPPHCIILVTELILDGDWTKIETLFFNAMRNTGSFFHLIDYGEFIELLKICSNNPKALDYYLFQRCQLSYEKNTIKIKGIS